MIRNAKHPTVPLSEKLSTENGNDTFTEKHIWLEPRYSWFKVGLASETHSILSAWLPQCSRSCSPLVHMRAKSLQLQPTLCNPTDCSPLDYSVHGVLQARMLEWVPMPSSRGASPPRDGTHLSYATCIGRPFLHLWCHLGSPHPSFYTLSVFV